MEFLDDAFIGIDPFLYCGRSNGFQRGDVDVPGDGVCTARCRKAVDDKVDLTKVFLNQVNHTIFQLSRKRITIDTFCIEPGLICISVERS